MISKTVEILIAIHTIFNLNWQSDNNMKISDRGITITSSQFITSPPIISKEPQHDQMKEKERPVSIYYVPHQDDELLTMGHAIILQCAMDYDVKVVLVTNGRKSNALRGVNQRLTENNMLPITRSTFVKARNREFIESLKTLGVKEDAVYFADLPDRTVTLTDMVSIIEDYNKRYPNAEHNAFSYHDDHPDHRVTGEALLKLFQEGAVQDARFFIQNKERDQTKGEYLPMDGEFYTTIKKAAKAYEIWQPEQGHYGIGYTSVSEDFRVLMKDSRSKYHLANM